MRVGYARVSTGEQDDALVQQMARLQKTGVDKIFSDIKSGKSNKRQEFNKLLSLCKKGEIKEIVITRIDRLARSVVSMSRAIALFEEMNIKLTILDAPVEDISNPFSKFSINQMGALAQFESDLLQSRVKHGYNYFREKNKAPSHVPFGYIRIDERYAPDLNLQESGKSNWTIAREIIDWMIANKASIRGTTHYTQSQYGIRWSITGFHNWLKNPVLRGHTRYNVHNKQHKPELWDVRKDTHTALIDPITDEQLQSLMEHNQRIWGGNRLQGNRGTSLLSGQIYCNCCGGKCYISRKDKDLLTCSKRNTYGKTYCSNKRATPLPQVVEYVDNALSQRAIALRDYALSEDEPESNELIELRHKLESLEKIPKDDVIEDAIAKIKVKIHQYKKITFNLALVDEWVHTFSDIRYFQLLPQENKSELYRKFLHAVVIDSGSVVRVEFVDIV
jgi:site-specific DNA recombinase